MTLTAPHPPSPSLRRERGSHIRARRSLPARGAALLMALVVAALATVIVSGMFWREFVLVRTIDNQQLTAQSQVLMRGALDWARAILREDAQRSPYVALTGAWAQPLAETRLDQLGETSPLAAQATMSGAMEDAQSRLNLRNLTDYNGAPDDAQHAVLARLCAELGLPQATADLIAAYVMQSVPPLSGFVPATGGQPAKQNALLPLVFPEDVARIPGIDPSVAPRLAPYVVVLDERTPVNFNTASAEVIAAEIEGLSLADARGLVADRDRNPFINVGDITNRLRGRGSSFSPNDVTVTSRYFFVRGEIKLERADIRMEALVKRSQTGQLGPIDVMWDRES